MKYKLTETYTLKLNNAQYFKKSLYICGPFILFVSTFNSSSYFINLFNLTLVGISSGFYYPYKTSLNLSSEGNLPEVFNLSDV
jgi:hypothetical protein